MIHTHTWVVDALLAGEPPHLAALPVPRLAFGLLHLFSTSRPQGFLVRRRRFVVPTAPAS